jgi:hypothetical protein
MPRLESAYKTGLCHRIRERIPGSLVLRLDPSDQQGIPDILVLFNDRWGTLEGKRDAKAPYQPNQPYFVELMNEMSFSAFIYPEIEEEVLHALESALRSY